MSSDTKEIRDLIDKMNNPTKPDEVLPVMDNPVKPDEVMPVKPEPVQLVIEENYKQDTITLKIGANNGLIFTSKQALEFAISLRQSVHRMHKHRQSDGLKPVKTSKTKRGKR